MAKQKPSNYVKTTSVLLLIFSLSIFYNSAFAQLTVRSIVVDGNNRTKNYVVIRELSFKQGDVLSKDALNQKISQSELNLLNTSLFNFAEIDFVTDTSNRFCDVRIEVTERWYLWPVPVFELADRNFNSWYKTNDLSRINFGLNTQWHNVTGNWDELDLITQFGKNRLLALDYSFPYVNRSKTFGAGLVIFKNDNHEIVTSLKNDKQVRNFSDNSLEKSYGLTARLIYRKNIHATNTLELGYSKSVFDPTLQINDTTSSEFRLFNLNTLSAYYKVKADHRDIRYYPLNGWYTDVEINAALSRGNDSRHSYVWFKSTNRYFKPLGARFYSGVSLTLKHTIGNEPFYLRRCLGYGREYVRGYEYYVIDGSGFAMLKSNLKFAILPQRNLTLPLSKWKKFNKAHFAAYLNLFADAAKTINNFENKNTGNVLPSQLLLGYGAGLDLVTYYDFVLRIEFSVNRMKEKGIFFHMVSGI